jgi:hypothetical protein
MSGLLASKGIRHEAEVVLNTLRGPTSSLNDEQEAGCLFIFLSKLQTKKPGINGQEI